MCREALFWPSSTVFDGSEASFWLPTRGACTLLIDLQVGVELTESIALTPMHAACTHTHLCTHAPRTHTMHAESTPRHCEDSAGQVPAELSEIALQVSAECENLLHSPNTQSAALLQRTLNAAEPQLFSYRSIIILLALTHCQTSPMLSTVLSTVLCPPPTAHWLIAAHELPGTCWELSCSDRMPTPDGSCSKKSLWAPVVVRVSLSCVTL